MRRSLPHRPAWSGRIRRLVRYAAIATLVPALAGCMLLAREFPDAGLDIPESYRTKPRKGDRALPSVVWWRGFRSKQLTTLVEEAITSNLDIAVAVARIVQADAQSRIIGAALLPAIDYNASVVHSRTPGSSGSGATERTNYSTSFSASYEIDFWGKNAAALRSAESNAVAARFNREVVMLSTIVAVATSYFQILGAEDRLRTSRNNLEAATRVLKLIQERLNVGTASALDTAQQEALVATQRTAIPLLELIVRQNVAVLAVLIGRPPERVTVKGGSMYQLTIPSPTPGMPSDLLTQRPDIRQAEALLASVNADVESAKAAFFPSIQLTGEGGFTSTILRTLLRPESAFFTLAAGLLQPVFDGGRLKGQYDLQKGRQDEFLQLYRKSVISAFSDVEQALIAVEQSTKREQLQRDVVTSSRRAFDIAETRLREGTVDLITVLNVQQTLFQAEDQLANVRLVRLLAVVSLFQALGGGWQIPRQPNPDSKPPAL
jgi:NodT family efflux transporter outer membrane factor (OMF) lipoprotein